jgi:hypothetical protein
MQKIKIGDTVDSKYGPGKVTSIEMFPTDSSFADDPDNIIMQEIFICDKDRCVFDLDNGHWQYGEQISVINQSKS